MLSILSFLACRRPARCNNTRHNNVRYNDVRYNDVRYNNARYNSATLLILLAALGLAGMLHAAAVPRASVDRNIVTEGDSLTLTIQTDETGGTAPDYSALQSDFEVYGSSQSTRRSLINGSLQSSTEWQVTLVPRRSGTLTIPPLPVAGTRTQPLAIRVNPASAAATSDAAEPVFLEAQLDRQSAYVQQQVILTVRVFRAIELDNMHLSEPSFDNASMRKIAETTFQREIHGATYLVYELSYAIFPQQAGELTVPELVFNAVQPVTRRTMFDFPGQGRRLRKMSPQLHLTVKPIPKNFTGQTWLPAKNLTLTQNWNDTEQTVGVGDSVTRNISIEADGLLAAQLPAIESPQLDNARIYSDQPTLDDQQSAGGIRGKRTDNMAVLPSRAGDLQLPEVRVTWWDVDSDTEKVATLPPSTLHITGGTQPAQAAAQPPASKTAASAPAAAAVAPAATPVADTTAVRWWQLATLLLALAWLATLYFNWRLRHRASAPAPAAAPSSPASASETAAFDRLKETCRAGDAAAARTALNDWARIFYRASRRQTLEQMIPASGSAALLREVQQLDNRLFGTHPESGDWNGENLLSVVRELRRAKTAPGDHATPALSPLYPT
jgi:hypothetical protein